MNRSLEDSLEQRYQLYVDMREKGVPGTAFVHLAEIFHIITHQDLPNGVKDGWAETIVQVSKVLPHDDVCIDLAIKLGQLRQIVSVPGLFDEDEILLVLTLRVELEIAALFFDDLGWDSSQLQEDSVDKALRDILEDECNTAQRTSSIRLIQKNWGIPLVSEWL